MRRNLEEACLPIAFKIISMCSHACPTWHPLKWSPIIAIAQCGPGFVESKFLSTCWYTQPFEFAYDDSKGSDVVEIEPSAEEMNDFDYQCARFDKTG